MKSYECEIVSYMFAHGADQGTFELRATEIKGLLRFWFRTALSSKLQDNIKGLKFIESYIFGDTSQKSKVIISVDAKPSLKVPIQDKKLNLTGIPFPIDPIKYIAFGMYKNPKDTKMYRNPRDTQWNSYVDSGTFKINVELFTSDDKEKEYIASILDNLFFLFSTFGGIGAKSDKGFGSFQIKSIKYEPGKLQEDINNAVENIFKNSKEIFDSKKPKDINFEVVNFKGLPSYPFLNLKKPETFGSIPLGNVNLNEALSKIGEQYYKFRRKVEKDGNFNSSYKNENSSYKAKRALLGLPILYQQPRPTVTLKNSTGRKASSLHMSLKKINSNYYLFYVFLRAKICDGKLVANGTKVTPSSDFVDLYNKFREIWGVKDE